MASLRAYDATDWRLPLYHHADFHAALSTGLVEDGIHQIRLAEDQTLDVCAKGLGGIAKHDAPRAVLVGLTGKISARNGKPAPFFSGLGIARALRLPVIAISDPTLAFDGRLELAWYAGNQAVPDLPVVLAKLLDHVAMQYRARLLIFGGSGGGYAGLLQTALLKSDATVLVWNPQTAIADYAPEYVKRYIETAFPRLRVMSPQPRNNGSAKHAECLRAVLDSTGIVHEVRSFALGPNIELLYLQNRSDWHVAEHANPYLTTRTWNRIGQAAFSDQEARCAVIFGSWGDGHVPPPKEMLVAALSRLASGEHVPQVAQALDGGLTGVCSRTPPFHWPPANPEFAESID